MTVHTILTSVCSCSSGPAPLIVIQSFNELIGYTIIQPQEARDHSNKNQMSITRHSRTKTDELTMTQYGTR